MERSFDFSSVLKNHAKTNKSRPIQFTSVAAGVQKRLKNNIKCSKNSRWNIIDGIRNLQQCHSPVAVPDDANWKVEHRRQQLEKWKEQKENKKKEQAAQKKKPFVTGVVHAPLTYVPPPPPRKTTQSTLGPVTRSQTARFAKPKNIESEPLQSFAPKNATFKPSLQNIPKIPALRARKSAKPIKIEPMKFEPVITNNVKSTRSRTNLKQNADPKATRKTVDTKNKGKISKPDIKQSSRNFYSSSSSEIEPSSPTRKTSKAKHNTLSTKSITDTLKHTPKNKVPKSESSSEERLRSPKSPESVMTPVQIADEVKKISPCVTMSRGKDNARREMKQKLDEGLLDEDASNMDSVDFFRKQLASEIKRMTGMCETWDRILEQNTLPDAVQECVLAATGQARLLMSAKLAQFAALVEQCARPDPAALVTPADLHGFWDMVFLQVENVNMRFKKLEELRARGWEEEQPVIVKPKVVKSVKPVGKTVKPSGCPSKLKEMIAAARRAKKEQSNPPPAPTENKTFDAGFFSVKSPIRSPVSTHNTPQRKTSLLMAVLSSEAKKSASKNAPFAMLRASLMCKNLECDGVAPLPVTPKPQMNLATPGRSILKQKSDTVKKSAKKSIKVVLFNESNHELNQSSEENPSCDNGVSSMENEDETKENSRRKSKLVRQEAVESPVMTRSRRRSLMTPQDTPLNRSGKVLEEKTRENVLEEDVLEELQIKGNIMEKETPKRSTRRRRRAEVQDITS